MKYFNFCTFFSSNVFFQVRAVKKFSSKGKTLSVSLSFEGDFYLNLLCNEEEGKRMNVFSSLVKKEIWLWSLSLQVPTMSPEWCQNPRFEIPPLTSFFLFHFLFQTPVCPFVNGEFWMEGGPPPAAVSLLFFPHKKDGRYGKKRKMPFWLPKSFILE